METTPVNAPQRMVIRTTFASPNGMRLACAVVEQVSFEDAVREMLADPYFPHKEDVIRRHLRSGGYATTSTARYELAKEDVKEIAARQGEWLRAHVSAALARPSAGRRHMTASGRRARRL